MRKHTFSIEHKLYVLMEMFGFDGCVIRVILQTSYSVLVISASVKGCGVCELLCVSCCV